ncbi:MAG: phosphoribosylamine--glycine ligase [bacterium]|nr:phosphoribosylamine--glycine ligase [bacterium]
MTSNVLIVGRGGREHALAWKLAESPHVGKVYVAPGNGGTAAAGGKIENVALTESDIDDLIEFAGANQVDLTVIGPEAPLVAGIVDCFEGVGLRCFGPVAGAAQLEGSKRFSKEIMDRVRVATASYEAFTDHAEAVAHLRAVTTPVVIKASGLAAGKGVIVTNSMAEAEQALNRIMVENEFGEAGSEVIIEERLIGQEASVLAFCDGTTIIPMPAAQDHKPLLDGDLGPNTGGMGAYAPAPLVNGQLMEEVVTGVMEPVVRTMALEGFPYVGVLYAGLMLTDDGPKVLEFNCRFGDPETQVVLPLLETDLYEILTACVDGTLDQVPVRWNDGVAATVVAAAEGYPGASPSGRTITGIGDANSVPGVTVFHAGTALGDDVVTAGGRVLAVTGVQPNLPMALACAYHGIEHIEFEGMQYRNDIGAHVTELSAADGGESLLPRPTTYADAGVNIEAGSRAVAMMEREVLSTYGPEVMAGIGSFGGMFDASALGEDAVLVASTDGVGTKTKIATALQRYDTIGQDIVNHCVNDILVQGARPLFFLDYVATSQLDPRVTATVVGGMAMACREAGCALLGGETAEMPGVYEKDELDVVGTMVGVVKRGDIVDHSRVTVGNQVVGIRSSGLHTNGYSLARKVFELWNLNDRVAALGTSLGNALLEPHRSYLPHVTTLRNAGVDIRALVHITGGGLIENPARVLPEETALRVDRSSWTVPPLFSLICSQGNILEREMFTAFNMGVGMMVIVPADGLQEALSKLGSDAWRLGEIVPRDTEPVELA